MNMDEHLHNLVFHKEYFVKKVSKVSFQINFDSAQHDLDIIAVVLPT